MSDRNRLIQTEHGPVSVGMAKLYERPESPLQIHGNGDPAAVEAERRKMSDFIQWQIRRSERVANQIEQQEAISVTAAAIPSSFLGAFMKGCGYAKPDNSIND